MSEVTKPKRKTAIRRAYETLLLENLKNDVSALSDDELSARLSEYK